MLPPAQLMLRRIAWSNSKPRREFLDSINRSDVLIFLLNYDEQLHSYDPLLDGSRDAIQHIYGIRFADAFLRSSNSSQYSMSSYVLKQARNIALSRYQEGLCNNDSVDIINARGIRAKTHMTPKNKEKPPIDQISMLHDHINRCMDMYDRDTQMFKQRIAELESELMEQKTVTMYFQQKLKEALEERTLILSSLS